jgi:hypothetical protein
MRTIIGLESRGDVGLPLIVRQPVTPQELLERRNPRVYLTQVLEESQNLRLNLRRIQQRGTLGILYGYRAIEQFAHRCQRSGFISCRSGRVRGVATLAR